MVNLIFSIEIFLNNRLLGLPRHWLGYIFSRYIRAAIVGGVLASSAALALKASRQQLTLMIGLIPAICGLLLVMQWPAVGIMALIITGLIVPSPSLPGGLNFAILLLGGLIGLWLLDMIVRQRHIQLVPSRTVRPLLVLVAVTIFSFGVGQLKWFFFANPAPLDAQLGGLFIFILSVGAFLLVGHQVQDLRWLQGLTWVFLALAGLFIAGWMVPELGRFTGRMFQRGATANSMFWVWLVALAFSQALFNSKLHLGWRLALGGLVIVTLYIAYFLNSGWKSGYLPSMVVIAAIVGFRSWRVGLVVGLIGIGPAMNIGENAIATDEYSYSTRLDAWLIVLEMIKTNPLLGFGPANYYWYTPLFPIRGYAVRFNSHNQYLDIIAQVGVVGLACVLWFAWEAAWLGWRLRDRAPEGFAKAYVYGALGGLAGTLASGFLVDWFLPFVYNIGLNGFRGSMLPWLFLGGLVSIEQMLRNQTQS